jgi:hypothetical protein
LANAAGDRGDVIAQRIVPDDRTLRHPFEAIVQSDPGAGDGSGAGAAVGLDHVAVQRDLAFAQPRQIDGGAQRPADQALDFLGAAGDLAGR